jgi:hypothetical protein
MSQLWPGSGVASLPVKPFGGIILGRELLVYHRGWRASRTRRGRINRANVFYFLSSLPPPPSHHGSVWLLPAISLLLTNIVSRVRACLSTWWEGFVGTKKKTSVGLLVLIHTVLYNNCFANVFGFFKPVDSISYSSLFLMRSLFLLSTWTILWCCLGSCERVHCTLE